MPNSSGDPVIYLIGTCGNPNYGDELITANWLRLLARAMPSAEVWVDTPRPGQSAVLHGGLHPKVRFVDTLFHACWIAPSDDPEQVMSFGDQVVGDPGLLPREATGIEDLSRVDLVHILGGGYVNSHWPRHLALVAAAESMSRRYGSRLAMTGAGLTPIAKESQQSVCDVLGKFDVVDVRDQPSLDLVAETVSHATFTGDDAFLDVGLDRLDPRSQMKTLVSIQSDLLSVPLEQIAEYVVRTLQHWNVDQTPVTLVECLPPDDTAILQLLQPRVPNIGVLSFSAMWRRGFPAAPRARWITTRFHPHLVGAAAGAWGVVLPAGGDYAMTPEKTLIDAGSGWATAEDLETPITASRKVITPYGGALTSIQAKKKQVADHVLELVTQPKRSS